jgi:putative hydrolase
MKINADYHTHTIYSRKSHANGTVMQNALLAKESGLTEIAITDHGFSHTLFGLRVKDLEKRKAECQAAEKATGVKVLVGIETNILNRQGKIDIPPHLLNHFDIIISGFHTGARMPIKYTFMRMFFLFRNKHFKKQNTEMIVNTLRNNKIDILTHPGRAMECDLIEIGKVCAETKTYFELNEKSGHISIDELREIAKTGCEFVINSDHHKHGSDIKKQIGYYKRQIENAKQAGIQIANADGKTIRVKDHSAL